MVDELGDRMQEGRVNIRSYGEAYGGPPRDGQGRRGPE